jgi:hypothetical protein
MEQKQGSRARTASDIGSKATKQAWVSPHLCQLNISATKGGEPFFINEQAFNYGPDDCETFICIGS